MLCLFCVSYVCNLVLFIRIGRVLGGEQKQTKKKTVKRNRDSCCCAFTLAYKRKGAEGHKKAALQDQALLQRPKSGL